MGGRPRRQYVVASTRKNAVKTLKKRKVQNLIRIIPIYSIAGPVYCYYFGLRSPDHRMIPQFNMSQMVVLAVLILVVPIRVQCPHAFGNRAAQYDNETKDQKDDRNTT